MIKTKHGPLATAPQKRMVAKFVSADGSDIELSVALMRDKRTIRLGAITHKATGPEEISFPLTASQTSDLALELQDLLDVIHNNAKEGVVQ